MGVVTLILSVIVFLKYKKKILLPCLFLLGIGIGISFIHFENKGTSFAGVVIDSHDNYFIIISKGEKLYSYQKENTYEIGDYLTIEGEKVDIDFVPLESQFDFQNYLNKKGVQKQIKNGKITVKFSNPLRIREKRKKFLSHFSEKHQAIINAIMFSEREDSADLKAMNDLHIMRLASASGIFIYAYLKILRWIINKIRKKKKTSIIPIIILFPYFLMTFPKFTVIRILLLEILKYINDRALQKRFSNYTILGVSGLLFLLIDYHLGCEISFIMGFTLPIIAMFINDAYTHVKGVRKRLSQALLIYLFIIPFELVFYRGINPLSPLLITLLSPLFIFAAIVSLISLYGLPIYPFVAWIINFISSVLSSLSKIAIQINAPPMEAIYIIIYIVLFLALLYYKTIRFVPIVRLITVSMTIFLALYFLPIENLFVAEVCFINVGQGDACLIRKGQTAVLIDTGGLKNTDIATETLIPFFQKKRIYDIDLVITTHDDFDHNGAYNSLKENFYVKELVTEASSFPINVNGITFENYNNHISEYSEENDQSLVVGFSIKNTNYLIMGDATIKVEKNIMQEYQYIPCDILKVGHHGSNTSTCDEFVKFTNPKEAIISCGVNNKYGHPKESVLTILRNNGVKIRRTDLEGTIIYKHYIFM